MSGTLNSQTTNIFNQTIWDRRHFKIAKERFGDKLVRTVDNSLNAQTKQVYDKIKKMLFVSDMIFSILSTLTSSLSCI